MDWLKRVYGFGNEELELAFDREGFLARDLDPKTAIAAENLDAFPLDVNTATRQQLLRAPGVGPLSAQRILSNRRRHSIDTWRDLQAMGVVKKKASPFLAFPGHRPPVAKQLRLDLFGEEARSARVAESRAPYSAQAETGTIAPCGEVRSCTGCPMYGAPGHPGSDSVGHRVAA